MKNIVTAYKSLGPQEYTITPFPAYSSFTYTYTSGASSVYSDVRFLYGERYTGRSSSRTENDAYDLFNSVKQSFYSPIPYASYGIKKSSYIPQDAVYVVSATQDIFGEKIVPGTFSLQVNNSYLRDDFKGNLITSASGTGSIVGSIFYDKGIALVKPKDKPNLNPDPLWANGNSNNGTGWEFLIETVSTDVLGEAHGVMERYPGTSTVAAKIGTRASTYWSNGAFYSQSVSFGDRYKISGWVYAGSKTWRATEPPNYEAPGTDYPIGYILTYLDSSNSVIGYEQITTSVGAIGWNYLSKLVEITDSNIASFMIGAFIDGPYPGGYSYGEPVCLEEQTTKQGCPGYAWFAGFKIEDFDSTPATVGLDLTGLYITGGMSVTTNFTSSVTLYEHLIRAKISPAEFNFSTYNSSVSSSFYTGSSITPLESMVSRSRAPENTTLLSPYITGIGLYNPNNELVAVAKLSTPIQRTFDSDQTFIIKFDT